MKKAALWIDGVLTTVFAVFMLFGNPSGLLLQILIIGFIGLLGIFIALLAMGFRSREVPVRNLPPIVDTKNVQRYQENSKESGTQ
jgi:hypothetical protein